MPHGTGPRILVTGFGPFPGMPRNPSAVLAGALARSRRLRPADITLSILPTSWAETEVFAAALDAFDPDIVLMLGVAGRRRHVAIETLARNASGPIPDVTRKRPAARLLETGAPACRRVAAAPMPLLRALRDAGVPARLSRDAGRYICNALTWRAYGWAKAGRRADGGQRLAVFVHIPPPRPGTLSQARLRRALEALLIALAGQYRPAAPATVRAAAER